MAEQSILFSWTPAGGTEFNLVAPFDPSEFDPGEVSHNIPTADGSSDGEYQNDSHLSSRMLTMKGFIVGDSLSEVQDSLNTLFGVHAKGGAGKLRQQIVDPIAGVVSDLFIACRVNNRQPEKQDGFNRREWRISYRAASPYWQETTQRTFSLRSTALSAPSAAEVTAVSASWTPGGPETVLPVITVVVTAPGVFRITPSAVATLDSPVEGITINATVADTWTIDCDAKVITRAGSPATNYNDQIVAGGFFEVNPTALTFTLGAANNGAASSFGVAWRRRFAAI